MPIHLVIRKAVINRGNEGGSEEVVVQYTDGLWSAYLLAEEHILPYLLPGKASRQV